MICSPNDYIKRKSVIDYLLKSEEHNNSSGLHREATEDLRLIGVIGNDPGVVESEDVAPVKRGAWRITRLHNWRKNEFGEVDEWAWDHEFHNGVHCELCAKDLCVHCDPGYMERMDCVPHYICSECGAHEPKEYPFCHCGARMTSEHLIVSGVKF